jgi:hypothetical protein
MKNNVLWLMVADDPSIDPKTIGTLTMDKLLSKYKVGTEGGKKWAKKTHCPLKTSDLCPIDNIPTQIGLKHEAVTTKKRNDHVHQFLN